MQVRRPHVDRVSQNFLQKPHHGCVIDFVRTSVAGVAGCFINQRNVFQIIADHVGEILLRTLRQSRNQFQQLRLSHDHRIHRQTRLKLHLIQRLRLRRIGDGDAHLIAALGQHHHALSLHQAVINDFFGQGVSVECGEIK